MKLLRILAFWGVLTGMFFVPIWMVGQFSFAAYWSLVYLVLLGLFSPGVLAIYFAFVRRDTD